MVEYPSLANKCIPYKNKRENKPMRKTTIEAGIMNIVISITLSSTIWT